MQYEEEKIIKFCGIKRRKDIEYCIETKPTHMGFVFVTSSKRYYNPDVLCEDLKNIAIGNIKKVGVFADKNIEELLEIAEKTQLDVIQLHGSENCQYISKLREKTACEIWKAMSATENNLENIKKLTEISKILIDATVAGSGKIADWDLISKYRSAIQKPFILAGGLNISNIKNAIEKLSPDGVDISSGIETDGFKDVNLMKKIKEILLEWK